MGSDRTDGVNATLLIDPMVQCDLSETCQNGAMRRILVIEDHRDLVRSIFNYLEPRGYILDTAPDGRTGLELAETQSYDAIILDWNLPRLEGLDLLHTYRERGGPVPVLMLTARDDIDDKVAAFRTGVQDYLTKPFALAELEVRLEALMSRKPVESRQLQIADLQYDLGTQRIVRRGQELHLYPACRRLLEVLMRASPDTVTRQQLERTLWGEDPPDADRLRAHIYDLRKVIDGPFETKLLHTLPRVGYRLADERMKQ